MLIQNKDNFRAYVKSELNKYRFKNFFKSAQALAPALNPKDLEKSNKVGIRPQLVDKRNMRLAMDFIIEEGPSSVHVLNAISPAFTSSFAFSKKVVDHLAKI